MKRDPLGKFFLLALIVAVAGLAAVTRAPDSLWVRKATRAAVIGPWIGRLVALYREPPTVPETVEPGEAVDTHYRVYSRANTPQPSGANEPERHPAVEGDSSSGDRSSVPSVPVDLSGLRGGSEAPRWLVLPGDSGGPPLGSEPLPPLPIPSREPDADVLATAISLLTESRTPQALGPYALYTDIADRGLLIYLSAIVSQLESVYARRYGLRPLPGTREAIVLFGSEASYTRFLADVPEVALEAVQGFVRAGIVTTYAGDRERSEIAGTVIHEITHLLNKRALGPALPPWLDEGIADDLAQSRIDGLRILPGTLGGKTLRRGHRIEFKGAYVAVIELGRALEAGDLGALRSLVALDWEEFQQVDGRSMRYGQSSFFIRSLLDSPEPELAAAFRGFLRDVSKGRVISGASLLRRLGRTWPALDSELVSFVGSQAVEAGLPFESGSSSRQDSEPSS